jgi:hypothetical protein
VCVCAFSLHRESRDMILGDKPLISEVVLSHPSRSRVTSAGGSCLDGLVGSPPSARRCLSQRSLIVDSIGRGAASRGREGAVCGGDGGGRVVPHSISPSPKDADLGGGDFRPPIFHHPTDGTPISLSPHAPACTCWRHVSPPALWNPWAVGTPQLTTAAPKTLRKIVSTMKI